MDTKFLYETLDALKESGNLKDVPYFVESSLSSRIDLRGYQKEAFQYFITYFENENLRKNKQVHTLFHMATGSGKTVIMAGLILYLYMHGYRNFIFFVNQTNILEKTKDNFLNALSSKYLFANELVYAGENIKINSVANFSHVSENSGDINICFLTTQKLHMDLSVPSENSLTYEDFENKKIVFISDESHHVNSSTKKKTKSETEDENSWEYSVLRAFHANRDNIMLEFTATCNLKDKNVLAKYIDKMIYNYPLKEFRKSGYTKEFDNFRTNSTLWQRALMAIIMSEYRKYLFADAGVNVKPVVLFKSQIIKESKAFYVEFFEKLKNLSSTDIEELYTVGIGSLRNALDFFNQRDKTFAFLINSLKDSFDEEKCIIMNGNDDNTVEKQLLVNSLEDKDNNIRSVFAVDMLNEGWDVLNLFDIVRLYDTRQSGKKISPYTIREAQLIGRGARYCPFQLDSSQERFKRKYDYDLENKYRILETMYFHSKDDSKYIAELNRALVESGMADEKPIIIKNILKASFMESDFYKKGVVFSNKRIPKDRSNITELEDNFKNKPYFYNVPDSQGKVSNLFFVRLKKRQENGKSKVFKFSEIPYNILCGASECYRELRFNVLKEKYPHLKSVREFLTGEKYLGNNSLELRYSLDFTSRDIFNGLVKEAFSDISSRMLSLQPEFEGSREFYPHKLSDIIRNKSMQLSHIDENGGKGESQNNNSNEKYQMNLFNNQWFVFEDNYGTSEEKLFVKRFDQFIRPKLQEKQLNFYLIRNERVPELAIYSFANGNRFEPDFLLFIERKNNYGNDKNYQVYIEPKGELFLGKDNWKEKFLLEIEEKHEVLHNALTVNSDYTIIGIPFFNSKKSQEFEKALLEKIEKL